MDGKYFFISSIYQESTIAFICNCVEGPTDGPTCRYEDLKIVGGGGGGGGGEGGAAAAGGGSDWRCRRL